MRSDFAGAYAQRTKEVLSSEANRMRVADLAYANFIQSHGCAQSILNAFQQVLELQDDFWFKAVSTLHSGGLSGLTCGALTTGLLLIGGQVGRARLEEGIEGMIPSLEPCQRLTSWFKPMYKSTVCAEISGVNWFDMKEVAAHLYGPGAANATEKCARLASGTAYKISEILYTL